MGNVFYGFDMNPRFLFVAFCLSAVFSFSLNAEDWPMWRHDSGRTAATIEEIDDSKLQLLWQRRLPVISPAFHDGRLQFDKGYEPVVADNRMFIGSNMDDSVTAFDARTGNQLWKFFTEGPVRFAPVIWKDRLFFGSDDGHLYCVSADKGELMWKFRAVPSDRKLTGNKRLISVWPVRGGPVVHEDRIYFAAGVLPFEGVFVYSLDAATGDVLWLNDSTGHIYGTQPHGTVALGGLAPQGYLLVDEEDLVVPSSNAYPARFDLMSGKLKEFKLPGAGRLPGGWFASTPAAKKKNKLKRRGLLFDNSVNRAKHGQGLRKEGVSGVRETIVTGAVERKFSEAFPDLDKKIHSMLAADGKLFVVSEEGGIYAYGLVDGEKAGEHKAKTFIASAGVLSVKPSPDAANILDVFKPRRGLMVMVGGADESVLEALLRQSDFRILVLEPDVGRVNKLRAFLGQRGLYGRWVTVWHRPSHKAVLPPYSADLVVLDKSLTLNSENLRKWYQALRPFGGVMLGGGELIEVARKSELPQAQVKKGEGGLAVITRQGALAGATNYTGGWAKSPDARVKAPLGTLWFDDSLGLYKRSPQPKIVEGVMISINKDWTDGSLRSGGGEARLLPAKFSSIYTGRMYHADEVVALRQSFGAVDLKSLQPWFYRPPDNNKEFRAGPLHAGTRKNLLTGEKEARIFTKQYGCDGGFDYGNLVTMRSATAAFYDKTIESGPVNISGPRSGCTNSVIPAGGVLNVPYFYEGCTCSYPLPIGLSMVTQPQIYEQWSAWGELSREITAGKIQRLGINFGAPGDRVTYDGTLWLDYPSVGGPSPVVELEIKPKEAAAFYHHSLWVEGGVGWPWVAASGISGVESVSISGVKPGEYAVRLVFAEPENIKAGERVFDLSLQGKVVSESFDVVKEGKGRMRAVTKIQDRVKVGKDGRLEVSLKAKAGVPVLSGIEIIRVGLSADDPIVLEEVITTPLSGAE